MQQQMGGTFNEIRSIVTSRRRRHLHAQQDENGIFAEPDTRIEALVLNNTEPKHAHTNM